MLVVAALLSWPREARPQFGGFGMGGFFGGRVVPSPVEQINQQSNIAGQAAFAARERNFSPYSGNPNAFMNIGRQIRFSQPEAIQSRFNATSRRSLGDQYAGRSRTNTFAMAGGNQAAPMPEPLPAPDVLMEISRFFSASDALVWPSDSPTEGDLGERREVSDKASRTVLNEVRSRGHADIDSAADARAKLIDYGRPALQLLRTESSAAIADSFHSFLMSLYDAIGNTALAARAEAAPGS